MSPSARGPLTLDDIVDLRAYEREREAFRAEVIELKKIRRVPIGPIVTVVFENRTTMRFQIQEMARAERMLSDEQISGELEVYNPLIPGPGELSLTLFIELTDDEQLRRWLPKLVGIERSVELRLGGATAGDGTPSADGAPATDGDVVRAVVEESHEAQLTREEVTASVHYVRFSLDAEQQRRFVAGPVWIAVEHPNYQHRTELPESTRVSIAADW